jgi:hypothetical protein
MALEGTGDLNETLEENRGSAVPPSDRPHGRMLPWFREYCGPAQALSFP